MTFQTTKQNTTPSRCDLTLLSAALILLVSSSANADVPTPLATPSAPSGYCSTIYSELQGYLDSFNQRLGTPAPYPTLQFAQLQMADSNVGPSLTGPNFLASVMIQVQELKAMGFQGVKVEVAFPVLYEPFFGSQAAMQPYLTFYQQLALNLKIMGMKLIVENNATLSAGDEAGWPTVGLFYQSLTWPQFIAARAIMAGTIAQAMQPDYLMLSEEPDNEAANTGQANLNTPSYAAAMITAEIVAARPLSPNAKLGAGFGTWMGPYSPSGLNDYLTAYLALPLDYIDMHIYPINTEFNGLSNFLDNALLVASGAAAVGKPVAISESWPWKMENSEFNVLTPDTFRARSTFSFWAPIDIYFAQTMEKLANYTQMLYLTSQGNTYFQAYQTYGGTTANGGAASCTCTTVTCSNGDIASQENTLADSAGQIANYTATGFAYNSLLVAPPDAVAPSTPANLTGAAAYSSASMMWTGSTDNVGVAGYNVFRCNPAPCTGSWIANSAGVSFVDIGLAGNTPYQYQVQAFDMANNKSQFSPVLNLTTLLSTPPDSPTNVTAATVSPKQITLTWSAPQNAAGLSKYLIYGGTSTSSMALIATMPGASAVYQSQPLLAATTYYYGVVAVEQGLNSPMSAIASAGTLALPNAPSQVVATVASAIKITLTWQEQAQQNGLPIANYQIYQGATPGALLKVATVVAPTYSSSLLAPGTTYYFEVVAADTSFDNSTPSDPVSATTPPMPPPPFNLQATASAATRFNLTWQWAPAPGGLPSARFNVNCGPSTTNQPKVGTATANTFTDSTAVAGALYYCNVVAVDTANDNSVPSSNLIVVTPPMPNAPNTVLASAAKNDVVTVTWSETIAAGSLPVLNYKIYRNTTLPLTFANYVATRTTASYTDTTAVKSMTYYYSISAIDTGSDASALSNPSTPVTAP